ncbi:MAG TPA: alpha,alpha-trehalase TreF [Polyangiales bacterium]
MLRKAAAHAWIGLLVSALVGCRPTAVLEPRSPSQLLGELYADVASAGLFADSKTFADAVPREAPAALLARYRAERTSQDFSLARFIDQHFQIEGAVEPPPAPRASRVGAHIDALWSQLTRGPDAAVPDSSRLPLPHRYVVPGGRFRELYYWDTYFTMLGLEASGRGDLSDELLANFKWLIETYGHVPNGSRSYYLSRSQPPVYALMVALVAARRGTAVYAEHLATLRREYAYWMAGARAARHRGASEHVVRMPSGALLNRYWDALDTPRDEAYREDVATAGASQRDPSAVYRELRAAAESGWDFSSRWLADGASLATIQTTHIVPPDLNALLFNLEETIARACEVVQDRSCVSELHAAARARAAAIDAYLWSPELGAYVDYDHLRNARAQHVTAATFYVLYVGACDKERAHAVAESALPALLAPHGLAATTLRSGQQWDAPNGWAPLSWLAIEGLRRYGFTAQAEQLAARWIDTNLALYEREGKLTEKYDVMDTERGSGGEYPAQDGFGWTNGVLRQLLSRYPQYDRAPP